ncbi:MAG: polynucleotide kinase, partial [Candidatus Actinomarina sp.]
MLKNKWIIFDLDGTLADIEDRRKLSTKEDGKMDWDKFFDPENIKLDKPKTDVIMMLQALKAFGYQIAILTGRSKATKEETKNWLTKY